MRKRRHHSKPGPRLDPTRFLQIAGAATRHRTAAGPPSNPPRHQELIIAKLRQNAAEISQFQPTLGRKLLRSGANARQLPRFGFDLLIFAMLARPEAVRLA